MIKAVLLDLDETLLHNPPDAFVAAYIQGFASVFLAQFPHINSDSLHTALMTSIVATVNNTDPLLTNRTGFDQTFAAALSIEQTALPEVINTFLQTDYHQLKALTNTVEAAPHVLHWLHTNGYATAIATNPLFPKAAIHQRVQWAGINPDIPWLITSMDNTHFTKPNPAYFEEIISRMGFEPDETLMVGDDWESDIVPATHAGLNTFWVRPAATPAPASIQEISASGSGSLQDFLRIITAEDWLETLSPLSVQAEQIPARYLGNVAALHGTAQDTPEHFWQQRPDPNEWTPLEVVHHMLDSECRVQRPRLQTILAEDNPFLPKPPDPPAPGSLDLSTTDPHETVQRFAHERQKTLDLLSGLTPAEWLRPARHSVFGPTTLLEMAAFTARHDRLHINQLCQTIGKCQ